MTVFALAHPWMALFLIVFVILVVEHTVNNVINAYKSTRRR